MLVGPVAKHEAIMWSFTDLSKAQHKEFDYLLDIWSEVCKTQRTARVLNAIEHRFSIVVALRASSRCGASPCPPSSSRTSSRRRRQRRSGPSTSPQRSRRRRQETQDWAIAHWNQAEAIGTDLIKDLELPKAAMVPNAQSAAYKALKSGHVEMTDSGWAGYKALADHVRDPQTHGPISDAEFVAILAYTLDHSTHQPSYVMKTVTMDHQGTTCAGLMVKIRDQAKPNKRAGGYSDGGYGSSKTGRYGSYKSQSYDSQSVVHFPLTDARATLFKVPGGRGIARAPGAGEALNRATEAEALKPSLRVPGG